MSFCNTKTPLKPTTAAKWQVPMRPNASIPPTDASVSEWR